jgi:hypothetical protein
MDVIKKNKTQIGWPKKQKFIFSQFWTLEVHDQSLSQIDFSLGLSPLPADGYLFSVFSLGFSFSLVHPGFLFFWS